MNETPPINFSAIAFDLDGTLIDSAPDVCASVSRVLTAKGRRALTLDEARNLIGWGGRVLVEKALAMTGAPGSEEEIDSTLNDFLSSYAAHPVDHTEVYPGVLDVLERLKADGVRLGICTNKPEKTTGPVIEAFGLGRFFPVIACGDAVPHRKPDGRHVLRVLEELGADASSGAMIGDSENDILAAVDAGVKSVCVTYGYAHTRHDELGADALIDDFSDLPRALAQIGGAAP